MNKRLKFLEELATSGKADSFGLYGLAMEYKKEGRANDAVAVFEKLRATDPDYLPMYLMAGQLFADEGRNDEARTWLEAGIGLASRKGDGKAKNELLSALDSL